MMAIARQDGSLWFLCDTCSETIDTEEADFKEAVAVMRGQGWNAARIGPPGEWVHSCPECSSPPRRAAWSDRMFTDPNVGQEVRVEQVGLEVRLIFVARDRYRADKLFEHILGQLKAGALNMTLVGKPTTIRGE